MHSAKKIPAILVPAYPAEAAGARQRPRTPRRARVDAGGTRLRLRALHVTGHSPARIARALGVREKTIRAITRGDATAVSTALRDDIADLYDTWQHSRAPERSRRQRAATGTPHHAAESSRPCR